MEVHEFLKSKLGIDIKRQIIIDPLEKQNSKKQLKKLCSERRKIWKDRENVMN